MGSNCSTVANVAKGTPTTTVAACALVVTVVPAQRIDSDEPHIAADDDDLNGIDDDGLLSPMQCSPVVAAATQGERQRAGHSGRRSEKPVASAFASVLPPPSSHQPSSLDREDEHDVEPLRRSPLLPVVHLLHLSPNESVTAGAPPVVGAASTRLNWSVTNASQEMRLAAGMASFSALSTLATLTTLTSDSSALDPLVGGSESS